MNTKGQGYINVNNENLFQIIGLVFEYLLTVTRIYRHLTVNSNTILLYIAQAKEAWDVVESFRSNDLPAFVDTIKNIVPMIDGPKSLSNRITALEMQMLNGTSVALPAKGVRLL